MLPVHAHHLPCPVSPTSMARRVASVTPALVAMLVLCPTSAWAQRQHWQSVLHPAGVQAEIIARLWHVTLALCALVFVLTLAACALALWRARRRPAARADLPARLPWLIGWALGLSAAGLGALFAADVVASRALDQLPSAQALQIRLTARQWWWEAQYRDPLDGRQFVTANELHLPVGRAVIIDLDSEDVIHSLWLPTLHGKLDLIPGKQAQLRLRADQAGTYRGQCAEFCGLEHARMALLVRAQAPHDYARWAQQQARPAMSAAAGAHQRGLHVFNANGCAQCHTIRGTTANGRGGPDLTHLASRSTLAAGIFPNERGFLAGWITDARALKTGVIMPPAHLDPQDMTALLDYLEALQ
ncbi:c-type cytochrome [Herbaspirillum rubrisubalbicans]|uniref:c-type cytochrome n=1 Tax=Herbaspirillum rubrisubalbicans TaxID=80842 RepID=UPI0020A68709|nr:c-type cytochrome [Herbaspirillum rubrisubalbicans]